MSPFPKFIIRVSSASRPYRPHQEFAALSASGNETLVTPETVPPCSFPLATHPPRLNATITQSAKRENGHIGCITPAAV